MELLRVKNLKNFGPLLGVELNIFLLLKLRLVANYFQGYEMPLGLDDKLSDNGSHCYYYFIFEIKIILTNKNALDNESEGLEDFLLNNKVLRTI